MTPTFRNVYILFFSFSLIASFAHHAVFNSASAQSLIRDTEVETIIRFYSTPLFRAAGLKESNVKIFIVKDNSLNAFIAGGQRLFINTGLILASETANQIIGVIAMRPATSQVDIYLECIAPCQKIQQPQHSLSCWAGQQQLQLAARMWGQLYFPADRTSL